VQFCKALAALQQRAPQRRHGAQPWRIQHPGGTDGTFISNRIYYHISSSLNWGLAAALATILLAMVLALYWVYDRLVGIDNVKLG
jgi:ABC-type sugar transport system permease subunit